MPNRVGIGAVAQAHVQIDRVLTTLVQAWRCLKLYPRVNPVVKAAVEKLDAALEAMRASEHDAAEQARACEIRADGFYVEDTLLCAHRADVPKFALQLYREGAKLFRVGHGATGQDAVAFLEAIIAAEAGKGDKPLRECLPPSRLGVDFFEEAQFTQRETPAVELQEQDVLSYFLAQRQSAEGERKPGSHLQEILALFMAAERGQEFEKQLLLDTLAEPEKIARTLSFVAHGDAQDAAGVDGTRADHALRQTLCHVELFMKDVPEHLRARILENLSEGVLTTDEETRDRVLNAVLPPAIGEAGIEAELTGYLPPRVASDVLLRYVQVHEGTTSAVQSFINSLSDTRRKRVVETFFESFDALPSFALPEAAQESFRVLIPQPRPAPLPGTVTPSPEAARERQRLLVELSESALKISPEESIQIRRQVAATNESRDIQQDSLTFFYLYAFGELLVEERMIELLQGTLQRAMDEKEFDFVNHVVQLALGNLRPNVREETLVTLQSSMMDLYGQDGMSGFINHLAHAAKADPESDNARKALEAIADDATPALIRRLEGEERKQRRFDLLNLLLEMGPVVLGFLRDQTRNRQWFVVRNAVYLMGRMPNEGNMPALELALRHEDLRVRQEALKALALTPGQNKADIVVKLLEDPDLSLRSQAAELLGELGDPACAPELAERLRADVYRLRRNPVYALALLRALARIGGAESLKPIRRFLRVSLLPGTLQRPQARRMAYWALSQIRQRTKRPQDAPVDETLEGGA